MNAPQTYPNLFQRRSIGSLTLRNRVIMGIYPTQYAQGSMVTDRMRAFYRARAKGGTALMILEGPCIDYPQDYRGETQLRIDQNAFLPGLRELTRMIHTHGARTFLHLNHPAKIGPPEARISIPDLATAARLQKLASRFGEAAARAREAGFDGVEVQAGWGELISRLLSPAYNRRDDEYGGTLLNRARFLLETIEAIKTRSGMDFPIQVKLGANEYLPGGFDVEEAEAVAVMLEKAGIASILVSAGTGDTRRWGVPPQAAPPGPLVPLAARIKQAVGIPVIAIGKIKGPAMAEKILESGQSDFIALTRPLITDPDWCKKARSGNADDIRGCIYCLQDCSGDGVPGLGRACTVNPYTGREAQIKTRRARTPKRVVVAGGGPAGMQAAITAAERGHEVQIIEQEPRLGGPFNYARIGGYKGDVVELARYLEHRVRQMGITVSLGTTATASVVLALKPDAVVVATGAERFIPPYPGIDGENVIEGRTLWAGKAVAGHRVAVVGAGSVAFEAAEWLTDRGSEVTVLARRAEFLTDITEIPRKELLSRLEAKGVRTLTKTAILRIGPGQLVYLDESGVERSLPIDMVVIAAGGRPNPGLAEELDGKVPEVYLAGDCQTPGTGGMAIRSGLDVGMRI